MKKIIATVGPSLLYNTPLNKIHNKRNIYRINGAHGSINDIEEYIKEIQNQVKDANILMDLPGNKVRTANFENGFIDIKENEEFNIKFTQTNYQEFFKHIKVGDEVWANDSIFKFVVKNINIEFYDYTFIIFNRKIIKQ